MTFFISVRLKSVIIKKENDNDFNPNNQIKEVSQDRN